MWRYFELLSWRPAAAVAQLEREVGDGKNPRDVKMDLAQELVTRFHGAAAAVTAAEALVSRFRRGEVPDDVPELRLEVPAAGVLIGNLLKQAGLVSSTSEALRLIAQGGLQLDGERVSDKGLKFGPFHSHLLQVGKRRFARVTLVPEPSGDR
jgi:tyrosyl-tRNA synthetase